jgi:fatty-acyl-CoA synthase
MQTSTLWQILSTQAELRGSARALRFAGQETSYAQVAEQSRAVASALLSQGIQRGDRVAWLGLNHPLQIALLFACAGIGAIAMPLNYRLAVPELERILRDGRPALLVHDAAWQEAARSLGNPVVPEV